jgi:1-acyl-sn-glycerol-3-phosphate acyltransferase
MRYVRFVVAVAAAFVWAWILWATVLLVAPFDPSREKVNRIGRLWTGLWKLILGVKVRVVGAANIADGGPYLFVSNHVSYLDVLALYDDFPLMPRFLAKKTLIWTPVFGIAFYTLDHVYIDRKDRRDNKRALAKLAQKVKEGKSIFIFPGGRRAEDGRIGEWKKGAFVLGAELQIPLVPVGIVGSQKLHGIGDIAPRPGLIEIRIGRPMPTAGAGYEDRDRLLQQTRRAVEELLDHDPAS